MTSFYKTFNDKIYPISKFRYPNKMSVEELNSHHQHFFNIETVTFEHIGRPSEFPLTIDFKNYIGVFQIIVKN